MTNPYEPGRFRSSPRVPSARRLRLLVIGGIIAAIGLLGVAAGGYYATQLAPLPEFRSNWLSNVMGIVFWAGLLLFVTGLGTVLAAPRR